MKRAYAIGMTVLALGTSMLLHAQTPRSADVRMKAAQHKAEVEGDLKGAIEDYKKIVATAGANRALAAQALMRMAECYQKLGDAEARKIYERVTREFADQLEAAQQARARLASVGTLTASGKTIHRVWADADVSDVDLSPDGRFIAFSRNGNLMLREFATGGERLVARGASCPHWSPDGQRLAVCVTLNDPHTEIGVVNVDGTGLRTVYRHTNGNETWPHGWSFDGSRILAQEQLMPDSSYKYFWVGATDGAVLPIPTRKSFGSLLSSPDGKYLAYSGVPVDDGSGNENVYVMAADGTGETNLSAPTVDEHLSGWTPDGKYLLTDRHPPRSLWAIPMNGGKAQGRAVLVHADFGSDGINFQRITRAGALYYTIHTSSSDIFTASMDPSTGKVTSAPVAVPLSRSGHNVLPRWAPDSRQISYSWSTEAAPIREMSMYSFATGKELRIGTQVTVGVGGHCWSRDGASILFNRADTESPYRSDVVRFTLSTKETTPLFPGASPFLMRGCSDGLVAASDASGIKVRSVQIGTEKEVYKFGKNPGFVVPLVSHDGHSVAFIEGASEHNDGASRLRVVPSDGGTVRELVSASYPAELQVTWGAAWSPDDRFVYFAKRPDSKSPYELFRIPAGGGTAESTGLSGEVLRDLDIAPDGTRIAFSVGAVNQPEVWVMENFLPGAGGRK